jgi:hypothetical protein
MKTRAFSWTSIDLARAMPKQEPKHIVLVACWLGVPIAFTVALWWL